MKFVQVKQRSTVVEIKYCSIAERGVFVIQGVLHAERSKSRSNAKNPFIKFFILMSPPFLENRFLLYHKKRLSAKSEKHFLQERFQSFFRYFALL